MSRYSASSTAAAISKGFFADRFCTAARRLKVALQHESRPTAHQEPGHAQEIGVMLPCEEEEGSAEDDGKKSQHLGEVTPHHVLGARKVQPFDQDHQLSNHQGLPLMILIGGGFYFSSSSFVTELRKYRPAML